MQFAENARKDPTGSQMNCLSSHRIVLASSQHYCRRRPLQGSTRNLRAHSSVRLTGTGSPPRRWSCGELELRLEAGGLSAGTHRRQPYPPSRQVQIEAGTIRRGPPHAGNRRGWQKHAGEQGLLARAMAARAERSERGPPPSTPQPAYGNHEPESLVRKREPR